MRSSPRQPYCDKFVARTVHHISALCALMASTRHPSTDAWPSLPEIGNKRKVEERGVTVSAGPRFADPDHGPRLFTVRFRPNPKHRTLNGFPRSCIAFASCHPNPAGRSKSNYCRCYGERLPPVAAVNTSCFNLPGLSSYAPRAPTDTAASPWCGGCRVWPSGRPDHIRTPLAVLSNSAEFVCGQSLSSGIAVTFPGPASADHGSSTDFRSVAVQEAYYALGNAKPVKIPNAAGILMRSIQLFVLLGIAMRLDSGPLYSETSYPICRCYWYERQIFVAYMHDESLHQSKHQPCSPSGAIWSMRTVVVTRSLVSMFTWITWAIIQQSSGHKATDQSKNGSGRPGCFDGTQK